MLVQNFASFQRYSFKLFKNFCVKILPSEIVRVEGERIRKGDQVVLVHMKTGQYMNLAKEEFEEEQDKKKKEEKPAVEEPELQYPEINLAQSRSSFRICQYAAFLQEGVKYVKGGDVIRIYHQEAEAFLKGNVTPLYGIYDLFFKVKKSARSKSSNNTFQIELENAIEGKCFGFFLRLGH